MQGAEVYIEGRDPWEVLNYRGWGSMEGIEGGGPCMEVLNYRGWGSMGGDEL